MAHYHLLDPGGTATVTQQTPPVPQIPAKYIPGPNTPNFAAQAQSFVLSVVGVGAVSATAQVLASNDNVNWVPYLDPITATGTTSATATAAGNQPFKWFAANLTALSGTNAAATLTVSA